MELKRTFEPVNECIYCGALSYARDSPRYLATEHIIPEAINGEMLLPRASCRNCERIINPFETAILRSALLGCRTHLKLKTKRPKDRPKSLPVFSDTPNGQVKTMIPVEHYPATMILLTIPPPCLINGPDVISWQRGVFTYQFEPYKNKLLNAIYRLTNWAHASLDTFSLLRMLAKIAHGYAVAVYGLDSLQYVLRDGILNGDISELRRYVGGDEATDPPTDNLHEVSSSVIEFDGNRYLQVRIRLFASLGAPTYNVIAARIDGIDNIFPVSGLA
jgi:hypothetical protein